MDNYLIKKEVFVHETGAFKSIIATNIKTQKDYLLTIYDLNYYKDKKSQVCRKIISICQTINFYRCCHVFFDREIYTLKSIRPSNIGSFLKKFIVVEPFPMISLADYFDSKKVDVNSIINGFQYIFKTISTLHFLDISYGSLSPLNIVVTDGNFSFRPPNLLKYQCSCTPPPLVARQKYRFKTEMENYPKDRNLRNSKKTDFLCFGYLLCDYILYFGRNISFLLKKKYRNDIDLFFQKFSLPSFIMNFFRPNSYVFYDDDTFEIIQRNLKKFLFNRKSLLELYKKHQYVDPSEYNERETMYIKQQHNFMIDPLKDHRKKRPSNRFPSSPVRKRYPSPNVRKRFPSPPVKRNPIKKNRRAYSPPKKTNNNNNKKLRNVVTKNNNFSDSEISEYQIVSQYSDYEESDFNAFSNPASIKNVVPQIISYSDDDDIYENHEHILKNRKKVPLKIDNVECYTIKDDLNSKQQQQNMNNEYQNNDRFSAYSDAYENNDSDESFIENIELDENIENYNVLESSNSDEQNEIKHELKKKPIKTQINDGQINQQNRFDQKIVQSSDSENDLSNKHFRKFKNNNSFVVRFKFEFDKAKYSEKKFSIHVFSGTPHKTEKQDFLTINKKIGEIRHHHYTKEIRLSEKMFKKCQKDGVTVCVMFNHAVHRDLVHLNLRNISFVPFYDNNLNLMFSVQTTIDCK